MFLEHDRWLSEYQGMLGSALTNSFGFEENSRNFNFLQLRLIVLAPDQPPFHSRRFGDFPIRGSIAKPNQSRFFFSLGFSSTIVIHTEAATTSPDPLFR
jgi:hypothetical protein